MGVIFSDQSINNYLNVIKTLLFITEMNYFGNVMNISII